MKWSICSVSVLAVALAAGIQPAAAGSDKSAGTAAGESTATRSSGSEPNVKITGEDYKAPKVDVGQGKKADDQQAAAPQSGDRQTRDSRQAAGRSGGMSPGDVTCRELTALDTAAVPGVLYYISGFSAGQTDGMTAKGAAQGKTGDKSAKAGGSDKPAKAGGSDKSTKAGMGDKSASAGQSTAGQKEPQIVAMRGYYEIPVERVMVACSETPESRAADVMKDEQASG